MPREKNPIADEPLLARARQGDQMAFGCLVERYKNTVFATIVAVAKDLDSAQDIAQEVFLRAWFGLGGLRQGSSLPAWLRSIARNRAKTWLQRQQRQPRQEAIDLAQLPDRADSPASQAEKAERKRLVLAGLDQLSEDHREVLVLHYLEDMTTPEIARRLNLADATVRQRLRRARQRMQQEMECLVGETLKDAAPGTPFTDEVTALLDQAKALFQHVQYAQATELLEKARQQAPDSAIVSLLLADAYTFTRSRQDLEEDPRPYHRALALLDEVLQKDPDHLLARLRRIAIKSMLAPQEEWLDQQRQIADDARGGPYEIVAELELARRHLSHLQLKPALALYGRLEQHDWLACVLQSEQGVAWAMSEKPAKAIGCFERAIELTTPKAMAQLHQTSAQLLGDGYWAFWRTVDNLPVRQCQNHAWLAGLHSTLGDRAAARRQLLQSLDYLHSDEIGPAAPALKREYLRQMEQLFPPLATEPEVQALRREIEYDPPATATT